MKQKYFCLLFFIYIFLPHKIFAQGFSSTVFEKVYGGDSIDVAYDVQETFDGGFALCGHTKSLQGEQGFLLKINSSGNVIWNRGFQANELLGIRDIEVTSDSGFILLGGDVGNPVYTIYVIKTDADGIVQWSKSYDGPGCIQVINGIKQTADNGFIIGCDIDSSGFRSVYVLKLNSQGDKVWSRQISSLYSEEARGITTTFDSGCVITGYTNGFGAGNLDVILIKLNSFGNQVWDKVFGSTNSDNGTCVIQTPDSGLLVGGASNGFGLANSAPYIIKVDRNGNLLWSKTYSDSTLNVFPRNVFKTPDDGYIFFCNISGVPVTRPYLLKIDSNGNSQWAMAYGTGPVEQNLCYNGNVCSDGGFIMAGFTVQAFTGMDILVIKTDENGNTICEGTPRTPTANQVPTIVNSGMLTFNVADALVLNPVASNDSLLNERNLCPNNINSLSPDEINFSIYPNPASSNFTIEVFGETKNQPMLICIQNLLGQNISCVTAESTIYSIENNLEPGIYTVKIICGKMAGVRKLVVE